MDNLDLEMIYGSAGNDLDSVDWAEYCESLGGRHFNQGFELVFEEKDRFAYLA